MFVLTQEFLNDLILCILFFQSSFHCFPPLHEF